MQLTIGQMAKLNNVTEQTLRLYDKMGLLVPVSRDDENGYRFYDIKQSAQLDMIQYMKSLGMQLKDIKEQLDNLYIPNIKNILRQKQRQIEEETTGARRPHAEPRSRGEPQRRSANHGSARILTDRQREHGKLLYRCRME